MTDSAAASLPTSGAALLGEYLTRHGVTQLAAARAMFVTDPAVNDWVNGKKRPEPHHRTAIATWTNGAVPVESWLREHELAKVAAVVPFDESSPDLSDGGGSGERPAVDVRQSDTG